MKKLQVFFYAILLFSGMMMSCIQSPSGGGDPSPQTPATVKFVVTDGNGEECPVTGSGTEHFATVSTPTAKFNVFTQSSVTVKIDTVAERVKDVTFATNGEEKTLNVEIIRGDNTEHHTVKILYDAGFLNKLTVKDDGGKDVRVTRTGKSVFTASSPTPKATVTVEAFDASDTVKIDDAEITGAPKSKAVDLTGLGMKKLKISVSHNTVTEEYTLSLYYSDPNQQPVDPYLENIKITDAADPATIIALSPVFDKNNTSYTAIVAASVNKIKIEAQADAGIVIEGNGEHDLQEGSNTVIVKANPVSDPSNVHSYTISVYKAASSASSDATLKSLGFTVKYLGVEKRWITDPNTFNPAVTDYTGTVDPHSDELFITAKPNVAGAFMSVTVNGGVPQVLTSETEKQFTLPITEENTFAVTVIAPDGIAKKTYNLKVNRKFGSYVLKTFQGTGLNNFYAEKFDEYKKSGIFGSKNFDATVAKTQNQTTITAEPEYPATTTMKIKINDGPEEPFDGTKVVDLTQESGSPGRVRVQIILVSSALGEGSGSIYGDTYTLWIEKKDPAGDPNAKLKTLNISYYGGGYKFYQTNLNETFSPDTTDYTLTLPADVSEIRVEAVPESNKAYIDGWRGEQVNGFDAPFDAIKIPVVAENGNRKEYKIAVTVLSRPSITIDTPAANEVINVAALPSGYEVTGSFTASSGEISEIWVGSSGLPIQQNNGGKWVKAQIIGNTFKAQLPALADLPNGARDIKVGAFNASGQTLAVARRPVTITGSSVPFTSLHVTINSGGYMMPPGAVMSVFVYDEDLWQKYEDIVLDNKILDPLDNKNFPLDMTFSAIKGDTNCRVEVQVYEKRAGRDVLKYSNVVMKRAIKGQSNNCEVTLKSPY
ncbi:cadherin-like beta sandwich domain-containing protein [Treponema sp. Marseille-Q4132]|uniref:cadherin-like beta sandwich domain-containing protein n=1 Tax=Treponema sp. Marseille-Q4132 TaxID=2766701 RepID=UPI001652F755|nr:cadherin-like beta sandwich domain-containing protein [Treponema sp. Marseille-Q4132]QNL96312.1 cadherin-like beta sandwich domain-containing protein [Treponema sp. Marseille-Q4132]